VARVQLTFRQRDVTAAIKAVERAGHSVARVSISKEGSIIVELAPPAASETAPDPEHDPNPWDEVFEDGRTNTA
jgi:hypothetical protein